MTGIAGVYGQALYELARDEGLADGIWAELKVLRDVFLENQDFLRLVSNPAISKVERLGILDESFSGRVHPYVMNFLKILAEKGYIQAFADCCEVYRNGYNVDHNILPVKVTSAHPITDDQASRLRRKLSGITGKQIELIHFIDPSCMGGIRLDYDGKRVDDTVQGRLERMHNMLKNTIL